MKNAKKPKLPFTRTADMCVYITVHNYGKQQSREEFSQYSVLCCSLDTLQCLNTVGWESGRASSL